MSHAPDDGGGIENAALFLHSHMMEVLWDALPDASAQVLRTAEEHGVMLPEGAGGKGSQKRYRPVDALTLHHACCWMNCTGEGATPLLGRRLGYNAGAFLRRIGLAKILGPMSQGYSVLRPMLSPTESLGGTGPSLIRPEDQPTDPAVRGTLHPWPDLRDSLSAVLRKLNEVTRRPARRHAANVYRPTALASKALAEVARLSSLTLPEPNKD